MSNKKHILVTGANGQLGQTLQQLAKHETIASSYRFYFTDIATLDITDERAMVSFFAKNPIDICINAAAYTAVDRAEEEEKTAYQINCNAVKVIAQQCYNHNAHLIHISTDFVFDGEKSRPYVESDYTNPLSVYGNSKRAGEEIALENNPKTTILRTSWLYSSYGKNFVHTMLRLAKEQQKISVVADQLGTPTYAYDLATLIFQLLEQEEISTDVLHFSNEGVASWYDFAQAIFEYAEISVNLNSISTSDYPTPATRPPFSILDKSAIKAVLPHGNFRHWREALRECLVNAKSFSPKVQA